MTPQEKEIYNLTLRVVAIEESLKSPIWPKLEGRVKILEDARQRQIKLNTELLEGKNDKPKEKVEEKSLLARIFRI